MGAANGLLLCVSNKLKPIGGWGGGGWGGSGPPSRKYSIVGKLRGAPISLDLSHYYQNCCYCCCCYFF